MLSTSAVAQSTLVVPNSGFETPAQGNGNFSYGPSGATWTLGGGSGLAANSSGFTAANAAAPEGTQVLFMQGSASASQSLSTFSVGTVYTVTFSAAQRNYGGGAQSWDFRVNGTTIQSYDPGSGATAYTDYTATFTASNTTNTIGFYGTQIHGGDVTVFIDNVRITYAGGAGGVGIRGDYFANTGLTGSPGLTRTDATVNFDWNGGSPGSGIPSSNFAVRWVGQVQPAFSQTYTFYTNSDDGVRLWVNGVQLINNWTDHGPTENTGTIALTAGNKYAVVMEYYQAGGGTAAQLSWSSTSTPKAIIPQDRLFLPSTGPIAPSGLTATAVSASQINLSWTDNSSDENIFKIQRKTGSGGTYSQVNIVGTNTTIYQDTGLSAATEYYYRVVSNHTGGDSNFSNEANATITSAAINAPTALTATAVSGSQIDLVWTDASSNETGFKVERKTGSGGTYAQEGTTAANVTTYQSTGLAAGTQYYYRVRATNGSGNSPYGNEVNATTGDPKLTGTIIGTTGSFGNDPNVTCDKAMDGLIATYFDAPYQANAWVGLDLGVGVTKGVSSVQFVPRAGWASRMTGAKFQGSNASDFTGAVDLVTVSGVPTEGVYTSLVVTNVNGFRYLRYLSPDGFGNVAEVEFYGHDAASAPSAPSAPSGLTAAAATPTQINLAWTDNAIDETGFKVERKTGSGGTYAQVGAPAADATTYQSTGLTASTQYYFRIRATNGSGDSGYSNEVNATTTIAAPAVPTGLSATAVSSSQINLAWTDASSNETGFKVERKTGSGGTYAQVGTPAANATAYQSTGLTASTQYYFRIRATNGSGDSGYSNEANATTSIAAPAVPTGLSATAVASSQINLAWTDASSNETGFRIERKLGSGGTYVETDVTSANATTYQSTGLTASSQYYYRVRATNAGGNSVYSAEVNATTLPLGPSAPSGLSATAVSESQVNLAWTDTASNESGFKVERKTGSGGTYSQVGTPTANATSYQSTGLSASTQYYFRVRATNGGGDSAYSNEANATTQNAVAVSIANFGFETPVVGAGNLQSNPSGASWTFSGVSVAGNSSAYANPAAPQGVQCALIQGTGNFSQQLSGFSSGALYTMTYSAAQRNFEQPGQTWQVKVNGTSVGNFSPPPSATAWAEYQVVFTSPSTTPTIAIECTNTRGGDNTAFFDNIRIVPVGGIPVPPTGLTATAASSSQINLAWTDNSTNETGFKVERKTGSGGTWAQIITTAANVNSFQSTGLALNTQYYYRVRVTNAAGDSLYSNEVNATTPIPIWTNTGVYSQTVNGNLYEWIPTKDVNFQIQGDGKVKIIAPLTMPSSNGANTCKRFIYNHAHVRLSAADEAAIFGAGLALAPGNYGFNILWINCTTYDQILADPWTLTDNPATYQSNSNRPDYFSISIVPVTPPTPPVTSTPEILIPYDLQRVSWLPHYQQLPYNLNLPADRGFGITRLLMDVPLEQVYQKVTQINYAYSFLDYVPHPYKWQVMRAYTGDTVAQLISQAICDTKFGYLSQMDEDFGNMGFSDHLQRAQQVLQGVYGRLVNEKGVTSPNQTRLYDDYFSALGGYDNSSSFNYNFSVANRSAELASQAAARKMGNDSTNDCAYFSAGAYSYRNWIQGGYLDSFARIPEGIRIYNEIFNFEKRFMAAPDRKVAKMGWTNAEGVNSSMFRAGTFSRLHFSTGDIIRSAEVGWPFHMMLNEAFWSTLLGNDYYLWHSSVPLVGDILYFGDSWAAGSGPTQWQPTGGSIVNYSPGNPAQPPQSTSSLGQFPTIPHLGESGAFTGAWLVSQLTGVSDRISQTIEYAPFSFTINAGAAQQGYYNSNTPANGSLGNAKLTRFGVTNYGQANIVNTYNSKKPICIYTQGVNGGAIIFHNVYCGMNDVNSATVTTPSGSRTISVTGNSLHVFYVN